MRPTDDELRGMTNKQLVQLAEQNPDNQDLLEAISRELGRRTSANAIAAKRKVDLQRGVAPRTGPVPPHAVPKKRRPYLLKMAVAVGGLIVVGVGHGAGQTIWESVWPVIRNLP